MASIREIKRRKVSVTSTQQITNAMKLVATAKLQKAKVQALETRPYFNSIHQTISSILAKSVGISHPVLEQTDDHKNLYIVITSNRGLAGGYNNNLSKLVLKAIAGTEGSKVIAIGKKGAEYLSKRKVDIISTHHQMLEQLKYSDSLKLGTEVLNRFLAGEVNNIYLAYTHFQSTLVQEPTILKLAPVSQTEFDDEQATDSVMNFEPSPEEVLAQILPKYISSLIYGALREAAASEHGARMTAMDSATKNAGEMIDKLSIQYNRARQSAITQEITEIVGGAEALQ